ncbi:LysR family transcriptional regulator [Limimaricola pyoseonensis]|uniref:DNA-binding transcriptional regulator, LysR family n=1 Tax=Limimaricola pyoseonensis TaxID=521013 RepID=A0A1G7FQS9_9RHOB|nr:LysR family transcriptional regulator [Limimaricola pyoseonensis]SDE78281.1 DNA-binding transcriptional regulator, LysR family [Limimaricola pyoseonensis]
MAQEYPELREIAAFVAVAEDGGFAEAARRLDLAPSSLSRAVAGLEARLGVTLIRRTTRRMALTPEGQELLARGRRLLEQAGELAEIGQAARVPKGPLRVNAAVPFMLHVVIPRLPAFRARYPEIELTLSMTDSVVDLIGAHADVAIRLGRLPDSELLHRRLGTSDWRLVAAPAYLDRVGRPETAEDLARLEQVRFVQPARLNDWHVAGRDAPIRPVAAAGADNGEAVRHMVLAGLGAARFSDFMIDADIAAGRVEELCPGQLDEPPLAISAVYAERASGSRRLQVFLDFLAEALAA